MSLIVLSKHTENSCYRARASLDKSLHWKEAKKLSRWCLSQSLEMSMKAIGLCDTRLLRSDMNGQKQWPVIRRCLMFTILQGCGSGSSPEHEAGGYC